MRSRSLLCLALLPVFAMAQEGSVTVGNRAWGGLIVRFLPKLEPPGTALTRLTGGVIPTSDGTHRVINDTVHKRQFGYDLRATLNGDGQSLQLTLGPLTEGRGSFEVNPG